MFQEGSIRWNWDTIISDTAAFSAKGNSCPIGMKMLPTWKPKALICKAKGNNCLVSSSCSSKFLRGVIRHNLWPKKVLLHFTEGFVNKASLPNLVALLWVRFKQSAVTFFSACNHLNIYIILNRLHEIFPAVLKCSHAHVQDQRLHSE